MRKKKKQNKQIDLKKIVVIPILVLVFAIFVGLIVWTVLQNRLSGYPIASDVYTTTERTVVAVPVPATAPKLLPTDVAKYAQYGYGVWTYGPGLAIEKRLDLMPASYLGSATKNTASLLNFFTLSDIHITDKESPAQAIYYGTGWGIISGYSPTMLYSTQVLDSAVQTINTLNKQKPFNFGISLGDDINSSQYNELRWFIDVMDGKNINPDSGIKDDPVPGPANDYQDAFKAAGLDS